ncbi:MAG: DUF2244 domain-containing protein [Burkholderiales bacterium]|nr:DUF2244 domain-containing protein [Burkholderiales bacterium]
MDRAYGEEPRSFMLVSRHNNSLSSTGRSAVLGSFVFVSAAISLAFALHGAWMILPFAGAEIAILYLAFRAIARRAGDYESISICGDRILVERWESGRPTRFEFNRLWVQVIVHPGRGGGAGALAVRSHGREVEFGRHLTPEQRAEVARTLKNQLGRARRS